MNEKKCSRCQLVKPISEFYSNKATASGLGNNCKECARFLRKEYHQRKGKVTAKEYIERKKQNPEFLTAFKQQRKETSARYRLTNTLKIQARRSIFIALRAGTIKKPDSCEFCHQPRPLESHHWHGYTPDKWLDIVWLCDECHNTFEQHLPNPPPRPQ